MNNLKDVIEFPIFASNDLLWKDFFGKNYEEVKNEFPMLQYDTAESIIKLSDYNKVARLYGLEEYNLKDDEYIIICDFDSMKNLRNRILKNGNDLNIAGKLYKSKYEECKDGYILMSTSHVNTGIIVVPDDCPLTEDMKERFLLIANYNVNTDEEKEKFEQEFIDNGFGVTNRLNSKWLKIYGVSKISIVESSVGIATIITFIAIYLGIIFLIASAAILALKQLTESADNRQRYIILRKIGCDEKMINKALFRQLEIFFGLPLIIAIIHSIFGIQFIITMMSVLASKKELLPSIIITTIVMGVIYGAYFLATYLGCKRIIREEE